MWFTGGFTIVSLLIASAAIFFSILSFKKKDKSLGRIFGITCIIASIVAISYYFSVIFENKLVVSLFSSLYFISIDYLLLSVLFLSCSFTKTNINKLYLKIICYIYIIYALYETIVFLINPFCNNFVIDYIYQESEIAHYTYEIKGLYNAHLGYTYLLVVSILFILIRKSIIVPNEYKKEHIIVIITLCLIIAINATFILLPDHNQWNYLDYSIVLYVIAIIFWYWCAFYYSKTTVLNIFKKEYFEQTDQGLVIFDYYDKLISANEKARSLFNKIDYNNDSLTINQFLKQCELHFDETNSKNRNSISVYLLKNNESPIQLRCDYSQFKNKKGKVIGKMFVFTDVTLDSDYLTGYNTLDSFNNFVKENKNIFDENNIVVICDIKKLSIINISQGKNYGDKLIKDLAEYMKNYLPSDSYFIRGNDAHLIAICHNQNEDNIKEILNTMQKEINISFQYATYIQNNENISESIQNAYHAIKAKKILDRDSIQSSILTSLITALQETDEDTKNHVKRTQQMGYRFGKRINLKEIEQSQLQILCILHDIGKISIPLEILNKPGKLNEEEMKIVRTHAEKGYIIALSSPSLAPIATLIRYHHERWDGKGYPDGLTKESIPLLSRIIAVIDAYDAMTHDRVYRKAMSKAKAIQELKDNAGTQFDPYIVSEFIGMIGEENEITKDDDALFSAQIPLVNEIKKPLMNQNNLLDKINSNVHMLYFCKYIINDQNRIIDFDRKFLELTLYDAKEITNQVNTILIPKEDLEEYQNNIANNFVENYIYLEHRLKKKNGQIIYVFSMQRKYFDPVSKKHKQEIYLIDCASTNAVKIVTSIEKNKNQIRLKQWENTYRRDSLTDLLTHDSFKNDVEDRLLQNNYKVLIVMLDLDNFKQFNDTYGHHEGDQCLLQTAQVIQKFTSRNHLSCRMGGDEFALAIFYDKDEENADIRSDTYHIFQKISDKLKNINEMLSFSIGAALSDNELNSFNKLYVASDKAMYYSKTHGKNSITIYHDIKDN